jgi:hypothetical protein
MGLGTHLPPVRKAREVSTPRPAGSRLAANFSALAPRLLPDQLGAAESSHQLDEPERDSS